MNDSEKLALIGLVLGGSVTTKPPEQDELIGRYCIVRSAKAGVFAGIITRREGKEVEMRGARRIWYWDGAASLSQMADVTSIRAMS